MHSIYVSFKHLKAQQQFKFIVKNEFVPIYGMFGSVVSGFVVRTLKVAQHPSIFSILKTFEHTTPSSPQVTSSFVVGMLHGVPLPEHVYNMIGLVLHISEVVEQPKNPLSHVSRQLSLHSALFCNMLIVFKMSAMHLQSLLPLHI